jgi:hypothetical protein
VLKKKKQWVRSERNRSGSADISCKTAKKRSRQTDAIQRGVTYTARCNKIVFSLIILLHSLYIVDFNSGFSGYFIYHQFKH